MVLDPNVKDFAKNMANIYPNYYATLKDLKSDLDYILDINKLTLVDLFHKVATKCQDFVRFCEIHRRILIPGFNTTGSCCDQVFNKTPFFTTLGTCYTTNAEIWESYPFTFSNIKVWLDVRTKQSPGKKGCVISNSFFASNIVTFQCTNSRIVDLTQWTEVTFITPLATRIIQSRHCFNHQIRCRKGR